MIQVAQVKPCYGENCPAPAVSAVRACIAHPMRHPLQRVAARHEKQQKETDMFSGHNIRKENLA